MSHFDTKGFPTTRNTYFSSNHILRGHSRQGQSPDFLTFDFEVTVTDKPLWHSVNRLLDVKQNQMSLAIVFGVNLTYLNLSKPNLT